MSVSLSFLFKAGTKHAWLARFVRLFHASLPKKRLAMEREGSCLLYWPVIVAVVAVRMVEMTADKVVDVVAVRNRRMAAIRTVHVSLFMGAAIVFGSAAGRIGPVHGEAVLLDLVAGDVMQMAVVQIIDVPLMDDAGVAAIRAMLVRMIFVMMCHFLISFPTVEHRTCLEFLGMSQCVDDQVGDVPI